MGRRPFPHALRRPVLGAFVVGVAGAVLVAGPVAAAPTGAGTTPPLTVDAAIDGAFAAPEAAAPSVGAADDGDAVAAWRDAGPSPTPVKLLTWLSGAATPSVTTAGLGTTPGVAMAPSGRALAVWTGSDGRLRIARREPHGAFLAPQVVEPLPPGSSPTSPSQWGTPSVAIRPDGSGVVAVPSCVEFGGSTEVSSRVFDVGANGMVGSPENPETYKTTMGCFDLVPTRATVAAGAGGRAAVAVCTAPYCKLATRGATGAAWTVKGVDGTDYAPSTDGASPMITPSGTVIAVWRSTAPPPASFAAGIGTTATGMARPGSLSGAAASTPARLAPLGTDALAVFQTAVPGGVQVVARPIFAGGSYGAAETVAPLAAQAAAPYADPDVATWPDGVGVVAFADQPAGGVVPALSLRRRALGGTQTTIAVTPSPGRAVASPRVALAGTADAPLGLVATREAATGGTAAAIVLRRLDGVPPALQLSAPRTATVGVSVDLSVVATDTSAPIQLAWDLGDGTTAEGPTVRHAYAGTGARTFTVTATDAAGNARTASGTVDVTAAGTPPPPAGPPGGGDTVAPVISRASLTAKRFRVGRRNTATAAAAKKKAPAGTTIRLTLSERASVRIEVVRARAGRKQAGRCRTTARRGTRCTVRSTVRRITRRLPAGAARIPFSGRFGGHALAVGMYELRLVATDAAGNASRRVTLRGTVLRSR